MILNKYKYWLPVPAVIFWGVSFIATKYLLDYISPETIISMRLLLAIFLLLPVAVLTGKSFKIEIKSHIYILILAAIGVFHLWIQVTGMKFTTASNTGWIIGTAPVFIALLGVLFLKEKLTIINISGIFTATFGLLVLVGNGNPLNINFLEHKGDFLVLASAFTWGVYSIINKKISLVYSPLMTILYLFIMMTIIIVPFNINTRAIDSIISLPALGWVSVLFLGLLCSGISYVIWAYSLRELEAKKVGAYLYFEPLVTVGAAAALLKEEITFLMMLSGLIITVGVVLVNRE
jgi:drug/metabolite transporter (DMT)-like permease